MSINFATYGKVSLNRLEPGTVVFAHVPFREDPSQSKTRPVVVIERRGQAIVGCAMYSNPRCGAIERIRAIRHRRTCHIDPTAILIDRYNLVGVDPDDLDDPTWDVLADNVIWGEL